MLERFDLKEDARRFQEALDNRELTEREKELELTLRSRNESASWEKGEPRKLWLAAGGLESYKLLFQEKS